MMATESPANLPGIFLEISYNFLIILKGTIIGVGLYNNSIPVGQTPINSIRPLTKESYQSNNFNKIKKSIP